jgi:hypothetical protein
VVVADVVALLMRLSHLVVTTCVVLSPATASAQRLTDISIGRMIRVETVRHDVWFGPLQSVTADTVRIAAGARQPPVALAMHNVVGYTAAAFSSVLGATIGAIRPPERWITPTLPVAR